MGSKHTIKREFSDFYFDARGFSIQNSGVVFNVGNAKIRITTQWTNESATHGTTQHN